MRCHLLKIYVFCSGSGNGQNSEICPIFEKSGAEVWRYHCKVSDIKRNPPQSLILLSDREISFGGGSRPDKATYYNVAK